MNNVAVIGLAAYVAAAAVMPQSTLMGMVFLAVGIGATVKRILMV